MFGVSAPKPFRHQNLNLLPQELFPLIPKQLLHLCIDQHDLPLPIHHDHRIRSGFQKPTEFLLGLLAPGDVQHRTNKSKIVRFVSFYRMSHNLDMFD